MEIEILLVIALIVWALSSRGAKMVRQAVGQQGQRPGGPDNPARPQRPAQIPEKPAPHRERFGVGRQPDARVGHYGADAAPGYAAEPRDAYAEHGRPDAHASVPGVKIAVDADSMIQGVLYAEILGKRRAGRRR